MYRSHSEIACSRIVYVGSCSYVYFSYNTRTWYVVRVVHVPDKHVLARGKLALEVFYFWSTLTKLSQIHLSSQKRQENGKNPTSRLGFLMIMHMMLWSKR